MIYLVYSGSYVDLWHSLYRRFEKLVHPNQPQSPDSEETTKWRNVNQIIRKKYRTLGPLRYIVIEKTGILVP